MPATVYRVAWFPFSTSWIGEFLLIISPFARFVHANYSVIMSIITASTNPFFINSYQFVTTTHRRRCSVHFQRNDFSSVCSINGNGSRCEVNTKLILIFFRLFDIAITHPNPFSVLCLLLCESRLNIVDCGDNNTRVKPRFCRNLFCLFPFGTTKNEKKVKGNYDWARRACEKENEGFV